MHIISIALVHTSFQHDGIAHPDHVCGITAHTSFQYNATAQAALTKYFQNQKGKGIFCC
jgi:hypothetical protein